MMPIMGFEERCMKEKRRTSSALIPAFGYECLIVALAFFFFLNYHSSRTSMQMNISVSGTNSTTALPFGTLFRQTLAQILVFSQTQSHGTFLVLASLTITLPHSVRTAQDQAACNS